MDASPDASAENVEPLVSAPSSTNDAAASMPEAVAKSAPTPRMSAPAAKPAAAPASAAPESIPEPVAIEPGPSFQRLLLTSLGAFAGIVMLGGVIGLLLGQATPDPPASLAAVTVDVVDREVTNIAARASAAQAQTSVVPVEATTTPTATVPAESRTSSAPRATLVQAEAADEGTEALATEVRGVVELGPDNLALADEPAQAIAVEDTVARKAADVDKDDLEQAEAPAASVSPSAEVTVELVELPKAVYDRFSLRPGDSFSINIAANDKIGGTFKSVELTGLGELAPGFSLDSDGTLAGTASECGKWRAQYALNSADPAIGTSWIEITVDGCSGA